MSTLSQKQIKEFRNILESGPPAGQTTKNALTKPTKSKLDKITTIIDLNNYETTKKLNAMRQIVSYMSRGYDTSFLFSAVVKLVVAKNIELRKLVYVYLEQNCSVNPDIALLSVSTFQRGLLDRSPAIRANSLKILTSLCLGVSVIIPVVMQSIVDVSQKENNAYVKKIAATGLLKLTRAVDKHQLFEELGERLIEQIEQTVGNLLKDSNANVICCTIINLSKIPRKFISEMAVHENFDKLVDVCKNKQQKISEFDKSSILECLLIHSRLYFREHSHEKELLSLEDLAKTLLISSQSTSVTLASLRLLYYLPKKSNSWRLILRKLIKEVSSPHQENVKLSLSLILQILSIHVEAKSEMLKLGSGSLSGFYFKNDFDTKTIFKTKLEILMLLTDDSNAEQVLKELKSYLDNCQCFGLQEFILNGICKIAGSSYTGQLQVYDILSKLADDCLLENQDLGKIKVFI